jgi:hypothetical protein
MRPNGGSMMSFNNLTHFSTGKYGVAQEGGINEDG